LRPASTSVRGHPAGVAGRPSHLAEQVVAVRAGEGTQVLAVPAAPAVVSGGGPAGQRRNLVAEPRIQEEREDSRVRPLRFRTRCGVDRYQLPVSRSAGQPVEHVADVADGRARQRRCVYPAVGGGDLQPAAVVLGEQRQQPVVGVLAGSPAVRLWRRRRIAEDPEQDGRVRRISVSEIPRGQADSARLRPGRTGPEWSARPDRTGPAPGGGIADRPCQGKHIIVRMAGARWGRREALSHFLGGRVGPSAADWSRGRRRDRRKPSDGHPGRHRVPPRSRARRLLRDGR
jgi:hypothetical protein